jgi:hypothetical protein
MKFESRKNFRKHVQTVNKNKTKRGSLKYPQKRKLLSFSLENTRNTALIPIKNATWSEKRKKIFIHESKSDSERYFYNITFSCFNLFHNIIIKLNFTSVLKRFAWCSSKSMAVFSFCKGKKLEMRRESVDSLSINFKIYSKDFLDIIPKRSGQ